MNAAINRIASYSLLILVSIFLVGCVQKNMNDSSAESQMQTSDTNKVLEATQNSKLDEIEILSFSTDKDTYSSYEEVEISVVIKSPENLEGLELRVYGIKPSTRNYIDQTKTITLASGDNKFTLNAKTPSCTSGCGGVYPGPYDLHLDLLKDNSSITSSSLTIKLVS